MSNLDTRRFIAAIGHENLISHRSVFGFLIQTCLAGGPTHGMTLDEVSQGIKNATGLTFDRMEIRSCVEAELDLAITLFRNEPPHLVLSTEKRLEVAERIADASKRDNAVVEEWARNVLSRKPIDDRVPLEDLCDDFRAFYCNAAVSHGVETIELLFPSSKGAEGFLKDIEEKTWSEIPERYIGYRSDCRNEFPSFFLQATGPRAAYIASFFDRTFELCRLNIAKQSSEELLNQVSGLTVYLDTNIVFRLLGIQGPMDHLDVRRTIETGKKAGVEFRITPRPIQEFENAIAGVIKTGNVKFPPPQSLLAIDANTSDLEFLKEFHKIFRLTKLSQVDLSASVNFISQTLEKYGVRVRTDKKEEVNSRIDDVKRLTRDLIEFYQEKELKKPFGARREITHDLAEHDAFHIVLISELRPKRAKTLREAKFWFVTSHRALAKKAREIADGKAPAAILLDQWHQLIRTLLPRSENFDQTFVRNLRSPLFSAHRANYHKAYEAIIGRLNAHKGLTSDDFAAIVADASFIDQIAMSTATSGNEVEAEVSVLVDQRIAQELSRERQLRNEASAQLEQERKRTEYNSNEIRTLREQVTIAEKHTLEMAEKISRLEGREGDRRRAVTALIILSRVIVGTVTLGALVALMANYREGWAVRGTSLNVIGPCLGLAFLFLEAVLWEFVLLRKWLLGLIGLALASLSLSTWTKDTNVSVPSTTSNQQTKIGGSE